MNDEIQPALTPEEWADVRDPAQRAELYAQIGIGTDAQGVAQTIAILNDALPDGDPRKFTAEDVTTLRMAAFDAHVIEDSAQQQARLALASRIEALLPRA